MAPRIVNKEEKAREIAAAALHVFAERGFHATRMADIAEAAGIGKGTIYEYFNDKMEILATELDRYFESFEAGALEAVSSAEGSAAQLAALVGFSLAHVDNWADHCGAFFDAVGSARAEGVGGEWFTELFDRSRALVGGILERGIAEGEIQPDIDVEATAEAVVSVYEGYVLLSVLNTRCCSPARVREAVVRLLHQGVMTGSLPAMGETGQEEK